MDTHQPYEEVLRRKPDFRIKYRFYSHDEDGRYMLPYQGLRSNFSYEHEDHKTGTIFMIWPEFEDEDRQVILKKDLPVLQVGTARMWIIDKQRIDYHKGKINVGTIGYF
jgi:hypothetical protein